MSMASNPPILPLAPLEAADRPEKRMIMLIADI
jgi:hypothetical protein